LVPAQEIVRLKFVPADENVFLDIGANDASSVRRLAASVLDRWTRPINILQKLENIKVKEIKIKCLNQMK
jgi:hypothetical protein